MHPTTLVTNIKSCVPIQLDEDGTNFNTWVTLFKLHCRAYLVDAHIVPDDFSKTSIIKDSDWQHLYALFVLGFMVILVWLFSHPLFLPMIVLLMLGIVLRIIFKIIRHLIYFILNLNLMKSLFLISSLIVMNHKILLSPLITLAQASLIIVWLFQFFITYISIIVLFALWFNIRLRFPLLILFAPC